MADSSTLEGRVVLVTGGARGIGRATCRAFLDRGAAVALCDIDLTTAQATAAGLTRPGPPVRPFAIDVRRREAWTRCVAEVEAELGPIHVLVNNAGIMPVDDFVNRSDDSIENEVDINLMGVIHGCRAVLPAMLERDAGHIVNVASVAGRVGAPRAAVYSATKFGVVGLTEALWYEHRTTGVRFSYVMPSFVQTELISGTRPSRWPPVLTPEEVAAAVVDAVQHDRVDVYVPVVGRVAAVLPAVLPRRVSVLLGRAFGLMRAFEDVDHSARQAYQDRSEG